MWEARGLRFPRKREIPFLVLGIFLFRHFHRLLAGTRVLTLLQESAELAAGGFERPLLLLGVVVIQNRASILDHLKNQSLDGYLSQRWG